MSIEVWQTLPKNQSEAETIEQAIARLIVAHNDDVTAHLGENQAIQSHRASEIIDHLAESIVADKFIPQLIGTKLITGNYSSPAMFPSIGNIEFYIDGLVLYSSGVQTSWTAVMQNSNKICEDFMLKLPVITIDVALESLADSDSFIGVGDPLMLGAGDCLGFFIRNGTIYCQYIPDISSVTPQNPITGIDAHGRHVYKIDVKAMNNIEFYIDGTLVYVMTDYPAWATFMFNFAICGKSLVANKFLRMNVWPYTLSFNI